MTDDTQTLAENPDVVDGLVNLDDACRFLGGISRSNLYGLLRSGQLPSVLLGKLRMIPRRALVEFASRLLVAK